MDKNKQVISRRDAAKNGRIYFYTGKKCSKGHDALRFVSNGACTECQRQYSKKFREELAELKSKAGGEL